MKVIVCNSNRLLAEEVCKSLGVEKVQSEIKTFLDGEIFVEIEESVRGEDIFIIQSSSNPVNHNLMELLIVADAVKRASAKNIFAVIPYFGYARQDRKAVPRTPITAKLVADLLQVSGINHIITTDLHAGQIQGFFDIPVDNIYAQPIFMSHLKRQNFDTENIVITSPDIGGIARARAAAKKLNCPIAIIDKRRDKPGVSEVMNIVGSVEGKVCVIIDDIVDSAGTLCNASNALIDAGANEVISFITHGVLSGPAIERINNSKLSKLYITNSIDPTSEVLACQKIEVISIAPVLAEVIKRIKSNNAISSLSE
jgi:ribose-phosphate pyrophosphokinase